MNILSKRFIIILALVILTVILSACSSSPAEEESAVIDNAEREPISPEHQTMLDNLHKELEAMRDREKNDSADSDRQNYNSSGNSGFEHEVNMNIDGEVERGQGEEWWVLD